MTPGRAGPADPRDFPTQRIASLIYDAARDAAGALEDVPDTDSLDVTWSLHKALGDIGIVLWRMARFRYQAEPAPRAEQAAGTGHPGVRVRGRDGFLTVPADPRDPDLLILASGSAAVSAGKAIFGRDLLNHVHHPIARGLPVEGDPQDAAPGLAAALALADAAARAREIVLEAEFGPALFTAGHIAARDRAILSIADGVSRLDDAAAGLAAAPGLMAGRLAPLCAELPRVHITLRFAVICSAARTGPGDASRLAAIAFPRRVTAPAQPTLDEAARPRPGQAALTRGRRAAP